jgi:hypothetical protein
MHSALFVSHTVAHKSLINSKQKTEIYKSLFGFIMSLADLPQAFEKTDERPSTIAKPQPRKSSGHMDPSVTTPGMQNPIIKLKDTTSVDLESLRTLDGKTDDCNRAHTFDAFVDGQQMPREDWQEPMGHGKRIWRAITTAFRRCFKKHNGVERGGWSALMCFCVDVLLMRCALDYPTVSEKLFDAKKRR